MRQYEQVFPNPLLAQAFIDGVNFVGDPDVRALEPKKIDGSENWVVVIEDTNDDDDAPTEDEIDTAEPTSTQPARVSWEEFQNITKGNMKPVDAKRLSIPASAIPVDLDDDDDEVVYPSCSVEPGKEK